MKLLINYKDYMKLLKENRALHDRIVLLEREALRWRSYPDPVQKVRDQCELMSIKGKNGNKRSTKGS